MTDCLLQFTKHRDYCRLRCRKMIVSLHQIRFGERDDEKHWKLNYVKCSNLIDELCFLVLSTNYYLTLILIIMFGFLFAFDYNINALTNTNAAVQGTCHRQVHWPFIVDIVDEVPTVARKFSAAASWASFRFHSDLYLLSFVKFFYDVSIFPEAGSPPTGQCHHRTGIRCDEARSAP